jgi:HdeA/HdeB family
MARDASGYCAGAAAIEGFSMRTGLKATIVIATAIYAGWASSSASAQGSKDRTIEQYSCKDIMRESGPSRDVAIAFLRGFLLGKSGGTKFNIDVLHKQSDEFIERCLANPDEKAMDAMSKIIG